MSMVVASSYTAGRSRSAGPTYRRAGGNYSMRGLRGAYWQSGPSIPAGEIAGIEMISMPTDTGEGAVQTNLGLMGKPYGLAVMYARKPLLWLFLLFGGGWLGGYLTWVMIGRGKR